MSNTIRTRLIKIGNSQGIRIPKLLIEQVGLLDDVTVEALPGRLIVSAVKPARSGWEEQFQAMAQAGDDMAFKDEPYVATDWESSEWEW